MTTQLTHPRIILDTDPGGDDIYAFLWLLSLVKQGLAELVAVTSADGNVAAKRTFSSASQILNLAGFPNITVGRGVPIKIDELNAAPGEITIISDRSRDKPRCGGNEKSWHP